MLIRGDARSLPLADGRIRPGQRLSPARLYRLIGVQDGRAVAC